QEVLGARSGGSEETSQRAASAALTDVLSLEALGKRSDVILSVCPPRAAKAVARATLGSAALLVDANALAPATARAIAAEHDRSGFVDGGIVGPPPQTSGTTRLYLSGHRASSAAELFERTAVDARARAGHPGDASA